MHASYLPSPMAWAPMLGLMVFAALLHVANGWSGADAYTIVLLNNFDHNLDLQNKFYNAPNGTLLTIARNGYRLMEEYDAPLASAADFSETKGASASVKEEAAMPVYALDERLTTALVSQGVKSINAPLPFRCRLSGEWVVWIKERTRKSNVGGHLRVSNAESEPLLLHCRLPLPQNRTMVELQKRRYIARTHASMSTALEAWWHNVASEQPSRCLYGDGEKALTRTERYYELCPTGTVYRIQHERLKHLLREGRQKSNSTTRGDASNVMNFLHTMHQHQSARHAILLSPRYSEVFEVIGQYHPRISKPRWNPELLLWESWYPSTNPCGTHYTKLSDFVGTNAVNDSVGARPRRGARVVRPQDAYWKTVVHFRCPPSRFSKGAKKISLWTVTEVRQICEYHVELMSELVCGWEQELDSFQVNPIPCVLVD